jgi:hypothetical protein
MPLEEISFASASMEVNRAAGYGASHPTGRQARRHASDAFVSQAVKRKCPLPAKDLGIRFMRFTHTPFFAKKHRAWNEWLNEPPHV